MSKGVDPDKQKSGKGLLDLLVRNSVKPTGYRKKDILLAREFMGKPFEQGIKK